MVESETNQGGLNQGLGSEGQGQEGKEGGNEGLQRQESLQRRRGEEGDNEEERVFPGDLEKIMKEIGGSLQELNKVLLQKFEELKSSEALSSEERVRITREISGIIGQMEKMISMLARFYGREVKIEGVSPEMIQPLESVIPSKTAEETDEEYRKRIRIWFRERLALLEASELTFEENWRLSSPLEGLIARFFLYKNKENPQEEKAYRKLAWEFQREFEARRVLQRVTRIWAATGGVEPLVEVASQVSVKTLEKLFTLEEEGHPLVADAFRELEKKGREYLFLKRQAERNEGVKEAAEAAEREIREFAEENWATRLATRLWSITGRAAYYDIVLSSGDFFLGRLLNLERKLDEMARIEKPGELKLLAYREILWRDFNFGFRNFWEIFFEKACEEDKTLASFFELSEKDKEEWQKKTAWKKREVKIPSISQRRKDKPPKSPQIYSLENVDLGDANLWAQIKKVTPPGVFRQWMVAANGMEGTRKALVEPGGFYDHPTLANYLELKKSFSHVFGGDKLEVFQDLLARLIELSKKDGKRIFGRNFMFDDASALNYVRMARAATMIIDEQEEEFYKEMLNIGPLKGRRWAELRSNFAILTFPYRYGITRGRIIWGTFTNFFQILFRYVFGEDLGGR
jgi:hypothetical protein